MQKEEQDNSRLFDLQKTEEVNVADLNLFDKNTKMPTQGQRVYVGQLEKESRPLSVILKPYVEKFLKGAGTTAEAAASYGQQALKVVSGVLWWGYEGLKSLFTKTSQYIKPKFVLLTNKKEPNQEQLELINKLQRDKEMAVLGINELNELKPVQGNKCQIMIPVDEEFLQYLRNEKFAIKERDWVGDVDPTKTIMMPSDSFRVLINTFEVEGKKAQLPKKEVFNYGQFCAFEMEGKNQIEYQFLEKLRVSKDALEGYMVRTVQIENSDSANDSKPDFDGLLVIEQAKQPVETKATVVETPLINNPSLQQKPKVTVKQVPLIVEDTQGSRDLQLA